VSERNPDSGPANVQVLTWYAQGEHLPWRTAWTDRTEGILRGEVRCDTFANLLNAVGEAWAFLMPEPLEPALARRARG